MGRVAGKTALVTGGAMGMGGAMVRRFVAEGANVVIADVNVAVAEALADELGPSAIVEKLDVRSPEEWARVIDRTETRFGSGNVALGRVGEPDDIAGIVLFFAGDDARFVTGSEVAGDGGQIAGQADYQGLPR